MPTNDKRTGRSLHRSAGGGMVGTRGTLHVAGPASVPWPTYVAGLHTRAADSAGCACRTGHLAPASRQLTQRFRRRGPCVAVLPELGCDAVRRILL